MKVLVGTFILFYCNTFYHCDANPIEDPGLASLMSGFAPPNHKSSLVEFEPSVQDQGPNNLKHFWHNLQIGTICFSIKVIFLIHNFNFNSPLQWRSSFGKTDGDLCDGNLVFFTWPITTMKILPFSFVGKILNCQKIGKVAKFHSICSDQMEASFPAKF